MFSLPRVGILSVACALLALAISPTLRWGTNSIVFAQCPIYHYAGGADSGSGVGNIGTGGIIFIPADWTLNDQTGAFIANAVWIFSPSNSYYWSSEGGIFIGWNAQLAQFQSIWSYYHTVQQGAYEFDDNQAIYPGYSYVAEIWYEPNSYFGTTASYFSGFPYDGAPGPGWSNSYEDNGLWSGAFQNTAQGGETDVTCSDWSAMYDYDLAWTPDSVNWYPWGFLNPWSVYSSGAPPPYVNVYPVSSNEYYSTR